jgi:hypothetical protein
MRRLKLRGNKKAAFEMSITTIVILVIAMTMLILGMILVRKMMCAGMGIMDDVTSGTRTQINQLFNSNQGKEVICLGEGGKIQDIFPTGNIQNAYCGFKTDGPGTTFSFTVDKANPTVIGLPKEDVIKWITVVTPSTVSVSTGEEVISPLFYLSIPKDAPEGFFSVTVTTTKQGGSAQTHRLQFNIKRAGWFKETIC